MSATISLEKLKRIMYSALRWRLQIPNYYPHNPIPRDDDLNTFSQGVKCAYRDLLEEIEKVEKAENQRRIWRKRKHNPGVADTIDIEILMDEIKRR